MRKRHWNRAWKWPSVVFLGVGAISQMWVTSSDIQIWLWPGLYTTDRIDGNRAIYSFIINTIINIIIVIIICIFFFKGKYFYIEASNQATGDNAKLTFMVPRNKSSCCLKFFYHMYGSTMGTLNVFSGNNKIFTKSGNQGNYWKRVTRTVYFSDMVN